MLKVPPGDRVGIWRQYWLLKVHIDPIRFICGETPSWSWPTVKKVALAFLELSESEVRALEKPLLLDKWRELMTALDLGESEVRALGYPLLLERWRELKSGEDIGEDNVPDQGGEKLQELLLASATEESAITQIIEALKKIPTRVFESPEQETAVLAAISADKDQRQQKQAIDYLSRALPRLQRERRKRVRLDNM